MFARASVLAALVACATAPRPEPKGGPRGLRASEHLEAAQTHEEMSRQSITGRERRLDMLAVSPETVPVPWTRSWQPTDDHDRAAANHRSAAAAQQAEFDDACQGRSGADVSVSPFVRYAVGGWPTSTGMVMYLSSKAGPADRLVGDLRCHRAWMMLAPAAMDDCPLDLPGLAVDAHGEEGGITVTVTVKDPRLVDELHRRASVELESAARHRTEPAH